MTDETTFSYGWDIGGPEGDATHVVFAGKYWFDERWEADVTAQSFLIYDLSSMMVKYEGKRNNFVDLTDYRPLARFLRWVMRRRFNPCAFRTDMLN